MVNLEAQPLSLGVNFQPATAPIPTNCLADFGELFAVRTNGLSYGWNVDHTGRAWMRPSNNAPDTRYETGVDLLPDGSSVWEIAVTNGIYTVVLVAGDATRLDTVYRLDIEGVPAILNTIQGTNHWVKGAATVRISDGRLTLRGSARALNNRLCFVDIQSFQRPVISTRLATNKVFGMSYWQPPGSTFSPEVSTNWTYWNSAGSSSCGPDGAPGGMSDPNTAAYPKRFFRTRLQLPQASRLVYSNGFEGALGMGWSRFGGALPISTTPAGGRKFLGPFQSERIDFQLSNAPLPPGIVTVSFDLFLIGTWNGNGPAGSDAWAFYQSLPHTLDATFSNGTHGQSYPVNVLKAPAITPEFDARTGAAETNTLGYAAPGDSVYRLTFSAWTYALTWLTFEGRLAAGNTNASWGLDNVVISAVDIR